jgi:hypothetical protein
VAAGEAGVASRPIIHEHELVLESAAFLPSASRDCVKTSSVAACTIVAKSYLSLGRVLARSFRRHHPEIPFLTLLAAEVDGYFDPATEPFELLHLSELEIPQAECFRYE